LIENINLIKKEVLWSIYWGISEKTVLRFAKIKTTYEAVDFTNRDKHCE
jgi:hypothetical protein